MKTKIAIAILAASILTTGANAGVHKFKHEQKYWNYEAIEKEHKSTFGETKYVNVQKKFKTYVAIENSIVKSENDKLFNMQPISELVGKDGNRRSIRLGMSTYENDKYDNDLQKYRVYLFAYNNKEKNDERGWGFGGEFLSYNFEKMPKLGLVFGGEIGFGWQNMKGEQRNVSTSVTKYLFVTTEQDKLEQDQNKPTVAVFTEDTWKLEAGLNLGLSYQIYKNLQADLDYVLRRNDYQVSYYNIDSKKQLNNMTFTTYTHNLKFSLSYSF